MDYRVIVDENAGPGSTLWQQFLAALNVPLADCLFLKDVHPGIPDVEILDKLLTAGIVLVTADRVLHMQAIEKGNRSYTLNERGQLTRKLNQLSRGKSNEVKELDFTKLT
jgi:hypothetical protein